MFPRSSSMKWNCLFCGLALVALLIAIQRVSADATSPNDLKTGATANSVDLRPAFQQWGLPPRVQGGRGTCSVFTMVGALEYALAAQEGKGTRLSVDYLNWAKDIALVTVHDGGKFADLWDGFQEFGICPEAEMPYREKYDWKYKPGEEARTHAKAFIKDDFRMHWIKTWNPRTGLTEEQFLEIKQVLRNQSPVCGGFRWPNAANWKEGVLQMAPPEGVFDGHSVLLIGFRDDPKQPGGGVFILRNSNTDRDDGLMPYEYARAYLNDALWIDTEKVAAKLAKDSSLRPMLTVRLLAVQVMDDDGGRPCAINVKEVQNLVEEANRIYAPAAVRFSFRDPEDFQQLRSTLVNSLMPGNQLAKPENAAAGAATQSERHQAAKEFAEKYPDRLVVFFRYGDKRKGATGNGYSGSRAKYVVMPGLRSTNMGLRGLAHEAGHYFGLSHTFARSFRNQEEAEAYLREHNNDLSKFDGDRLSDTPPDPGIGGAKDSLVLAGIEITLPRGNIMSYRRWDNHEWLSPQQAEIVRKTYQRRFGQYANTEAHAEKSAVQSGS